MREFENLSLPRRPSGAIKYGNPGKSTIVATFEISSKEHDGITDSNPEYD
jgi:hypothetical protein